MIFLLDTSDNFKKAASEIKGMEVGQLITPLTGRTNVGEPYKFAIDNGAFANFDAARFRAILEREKKNKDRCLFVCAPDMVGSGRLTLALWRQWEGYMGLWKRAFVLQDGIEDLDIPWEQFEAVFVGGTDDFKQSDAALQICKAAKMMPHPKWVHVGRVNTAIRLDRWMDVADSADGTGVSRYSHMRDSLTSGLPLLEAANAGDERGV